MVKRDDAGRERMEAKSSMVGFHFRMENQTHTALGEAAMQDERTKSDWVRLLVKRELRQLGLLPTPPTSKVQRTDK